MINAVLFDLDNTLIDRDGAFDECVRSFFSERRVQEELIAFDRAGKRAALFDSWRSFGGPKVNQALLGHFIAKSIRPDPTLLRELKSLGKCLKIGIVSNGGSKTQRAKLRASGLDGVFPPANIWISEEVGCAKPDPKIFRAAVGAFELRPAHCLFVGDDPERDLNGSLAAGLRARLVKHVLTANSLRKLIEEERAR